MRLKLTNVRLAFPAVFEAKTVNGEGEPAFSAVLLLEPNDPQIKTINQAIEACAKEKWGTKTDSVLKALRTADKICLHDGDSKADYAGFPGNLFVSTSSKTRPLVVNADRSPLTAADGKPYAGCYVHASIELWAQDNSYGKRVNAQLRGVQFFKDGDAFAGGGAAGADEFDDVSSGATADDLV